MDALNAPFAALLTFDRACGPLDEPVLVHRDELLLDEVVFGTDLCPDRDELHEPNGDRRATDCGAPRVELPERAPTGDLRVDPVDVDEVDTTGHGDQAVGDPSGGVDGPRAREDDEVAGGPVDLASLGACRVDVDGRSVGAFLVATGPGGGAVDRGAGGVGREAALEVAVGTEWDAGDRRVIEEGGPDRDLDPVVGDVHAPARRDLELVGRFGVSSPVAVSFAATDGAMVAVEREPGDVVRMAGRRRKAAGP